MTISLIVLYPQDLDLAQVSNSNILVPPQLYPIVSNYFCRLPRLWNSLPSVDISLSTNTIKQKVHKFLWKHF